MTFADLKKLIEDSLQEFLHEDAYLLEHDVNERTITHHWAKHIERLAKEKIEGFDWQVDVEYNRDGDLPKKLYSIIHDIKSNDDKGITVYPDIIIHRRGKNNLEDSENNNLLIIEAKKDKVFSSTSDDTRKIIAFIEEPDGGYYYRYGLYVNFITDSQSYKWTWFRRTKSGTNGGKQYLAHKVARTKSRKK